MPVTYPRNQKLRIIVKVNVSVGPIPRLAYCKPGAAFETKGSETEYVLDRELLRRTDTIERRLCHTVYRCLIADRNQVIPSAEVFDVELNVPSDLAVDLAVIPNPKVVVGLSPGIFWRG